MSNYPVLNNKYVLERTLGSGYSCKVKLGRDSDNNFYAIKIFKTQQHVVEANVEIEALSVLKHPNIVQMYAAEQGNIVRKGREPKEVYYLVLELVSGGEIFDFISFGGRLPEESARFYFRQLLSALDYMHGKGVAHRDLKPENLIIDENYNLKVTDFGFAGPMAGRDGSGFLNTNLGTQPYKAPELHMEKKYSGESNDLFAAAIILFILVSQRPPFGIADPRTDDLYKVLAAGQSEVFWKVHAKGNDGEDIYSSDFKELFELMTQFNPKKRPSLEQITAHPWVTGTVTATDVLIEDFKRRQKIVDREANKEQEEKRAKRRQKKADKAAVHRSSAADGEEDTQQSHLDRETWQQLAVMTYGAHFPKKTQFFTTAAPVDVFEELVETLKGMQTSYQVSDSSLRLKFGVGASAAGEEVKTEEEIQCTVDILMVDENKHCVTFLYRDAEKQEVAGSKAAKGHYKAVSKAMREFIDATYAD